MPPNFSHQVSFSRRQFSLAQLFLFGTTLFSGTTFSFCHDFLFSARLFLFGTTFFFRHDFFFLARLFFFGTTFSFRHDFFFSARLFLFVTTFSFRHDFFYSTLQVTADLSQFHLIRKFNMVATGCLKCCFFVIFAFDIIFHVHGGFAYLHATFER